MSVLPETGTVAPDFTLSDQMENLHILSALQGKWIVLYFYSKDQTSGCTKEACGFRDRAAAFAEQGAVILGVSRDSPESHREFAEKESLPFPLLADEDGEVSDAYGVLKMKTQNGKRVKGVLRTTFLIDPDGRIAKIYEDVDPSPHPEEVLRDLRKLSAKIKTRVPVHEEA